PVPMAGRSGRSVPTRRRTSGGTPSNGTCWPERNRTEARRRGSDMRNIAGWIIWIALIGVAGGQREPQPAPDGQAAAPASPAADTAAAAAAAEAPAKLDDIIEHTPSYVIGVSFPKGLEDQPGLARLIRGYADAARAELMRALEGLGNDRPSAPY